MKIGGNVVRVVSGGVTIRTKSCKSCKCGTGTVAIVCWICRGGEKNGGGDGGGEMLLLRLLLQLRIGWFFSFAASPFIVSH